MIQLYKMPNMKFRIYILLALILILNNSLLAQKHDEEKVFTEVNPPNFLVHNQLSPEIVRLEYAGGVVKGSFKNENGIEMNKFNQSTFTFSAYPLTLMSKRHHQLYLGVGYVHEKFSSFERELSKDVFEKSLQTVYLNMFLNTRIINRFYWFSYLQGGVSGVNPFKEIDKTYNVISLNKINMKVNRNMNIGLGIAYFSNLGDPLFLPSFAFVYSGSNFVINVDIPVKVEIEGIFAYGKFRPVIGVSLPASSYYLNEHAQNLSYIGTTAYIGMRYQIFDLLYLYSAYKTNLGKTFDLGSRGDLTEIGKFSGQGSFVIGLNIQVARFIPFIKRDY